MSYAQTEMAELLAKLTLSPRLIDVLALLLQGRSNKEIARDLSLSPETIKEYVATILHRLGVSSRAQVPMIVYPYFEPLLAWDTARRQHILPRSSPSLSLFQYARPQARSRTPESLALQGLQSSRHVLLAHSSHGRYCR